MSWIYQRFSKSWISVSFLLCSFFITVCGFSQLALAVSPVFERSAAPPAMEPSEDNVLWDQSDNASDRDIVSQDFIDVIFDTFDARAADDFLVPEGYLWKVEAVKVFGMFDGAAPDSLQSLDVVFFTDEGGFPGELIDRCNYLNIQPVDVNDPSFLINLTKPCILTAGTYWMSVRANMLFLPNGQWFWIERTVQTLNPFVWENPGNGFGTGCLTFSYAQAECNAFFPDLVFQLSGEERPFPVVPALGTLGLAILSIALGLVLIIYYRRMKKQRILGG